MLFEREEVGLEGLHIKACFPQKRDEVRIDSRTASADSLGADENIKGVERSLTVHPLPFATLSRDVRRSR